MGWWQINADTLAGSRFVISPFAEAFASLRLLHGAGAAHPGERRWLDAHLPDYRRRLARDPVTAQLIRAGIGRVQRGPDRRAPQIRLGLIAQHPVEDDEVRQR
ncbi:hypothetical protein ABZ281_25780, partial [Streptomyces sp. NPDC006265]